MQYKVTINKWEEHNPKHKKHFKKFMLSNGFFSDPKIAELTPIQVLLYLELLCICSESASNQCRISVKTVPKQFRISVKSLQDQLALLQSFQLLTFEKLPSLRTEGKGREEKEEKGKEEKDTSEVENRPSLVLESPALKSGKPPKPKPNTESNRKVFDAYREAYLKRYHIEVVKNATLNAQVAAFVKRLGEQDAVDVVRFYLTHNDSFYVKNTHTFGHCLKAAETLRTQMLKGKAITSTSAKNFEKTNESVSQAEMFRRMSEQSGNA